MKLIKNLSVGAKTRLIWFDSGLKEIWANPMNRINNAIQSLEIESVVRGHRTCATYTSTPQDIMKKEEQYPGLIFKPIRIVQKFQGFCHRHVDVKENEPFFTHCVITKSVAAADIFKKSYFKGDTETQGRLLGFPECCRKFFWRTWQEGFFDPVFQMTGRSNPHPYCNPCLRYAGIRVSFHIPCSFHCKETIEISEKRLELFEDKNLKKLLISLLSMPIEWDNLHGLLQVKTPLFWILTSSVPCEDRHVIKLKGKFLSKGARA